MNTDIFSFLTDSQKESVQLALVDRLISEVGNVTFKDVVIDLAPAINEIISHDSFGDALFEQVDFKDIGAELTKNILDGLGLVGRDSINCNGSD